MQADKAILMSAMITLTSTVGASAAPSKFGGKGELPPPRLLVGTGLAFMGLSMLGEIAPRLAVPLAASVALSAAMYYGIPVLDCAFGDGDCSKRSTKSTRKGGKTK